MDEPKLTSQGLWHFLAVGFVSRVEDVAKGFLGSVKSADQIGWRVLLKDRRNIPEETMHGTDFDTMRTGHRGQGMENLIDQRMGIDQYHQIARPQIDIPVRLRLGMV